VELTLRLAELVVLGYFAVLNGLYVLSFVVAAEQMRRRVREDYAVRLRDLLRSPATKPISLLVPAFDEEETIATSVATVLELHYPEFEVIVVNDGSRDATLEVLVEAFELRPMPVPAWRGPPHAEIHQAYRSARDPRLIVVDKVNGGKADALNAALAIARYPLFCAVDADSLLDAEALARIADDFAYDPDLVAAGGTIRVLNAAETDGRGTVLRLRVPSSWIERFQVVEYTRAFLAGRTAFSAARMLLIISGAFGVFRREAVLAVGGYRIDTVGEDMELVVRLHRRMREQGRPYRIRYLIDPVCWTQVPRDRATLARQRDRWHRGLLETLWRHRGMLLRPGYGRLGLLAMPYFWAFEALAPLLEVGGYLLVLGLLATGQLDPLFATAFLALAIVYGVLVSVAAFGIEVFLRTRYPTLRDRWRLLVAALAENLGYRQWLALVRFRATFQVARQAGVWGEMKRERL
jgi:cellulose synthase/poly-beta-1,6-N-acetylglucosamine synthase-like glycosyltransferase